MNPTDLHRLSPNVIYLGDIVQAATNDGQPFIGEVTCIWGRGRILVLTNHMGGQQVVDIREVTS